jgi:hypothetical protein
VFFKFPLFSLHFIVEPCLSDRFALLFFLLKFKQNRDSHIVLAFARLGHEVLFVAKFLAEFFLKTFLLSLYIIIVGVQDLVFGLALVQFFVFFIQVFVFENHLLAVS